MSGQTHQTPQVAPPTSAPPAQETAGPSTGTALESNADRVSDVKAEQPAPGEAAADINTTRPINADVPADIRSSLMSELKASPTTNNLLERLKEKGADNFPLKWSGQGSYYNGASGGIFLDRSRSESQWFATMAHEMVHMLTDKSGNGAKVMTMTRDAYVNAELDDEINAQATSYVAALESGNSNGGAGFSEFQTWLSKNKPELMQSMADPLEEQANKDSIQEAARGWVKEKFKNEWKTSNTNENYYDYYGKFWDSCHPAAK